MTLEDVRRARDSADVRLMLRDLRHRLEVVEDYATGGSLIRGLRTEGELERARRAWYRAMAENN